MPNPNKKWTRRCSALFVWTAARCQTRTRNGRSRQQQVAGSSRQQQAAAGSSRHQHPAAGSRQHTAASSRQPVADSSSRQRADAKPEQEMDSPMFGTVCLDRRQMPNPNKKWRVQVVAPLTWEAARCQTRTRNGLADVRQCLSGPPPDAKPEQEMGGFRLVWFSRVRTGGQEYILIRNKNRSQVSRLQQ